MDTDANIHQSSDQSDHTITKQANTLACQQTHATHTKKHKKLSRKTEKGTLCNDDLVRWFLVVSIVLLMTTALVFAFIKNNAWFLAGGSIISIAVISMVGYYFPQSRKGDGQ